MAIKQTIKIEAQVINGSLLIKDPRRVGPYDSGEWLLLPVYDGHRLQRSDDFHVVAANASVPGVERDYTITKALKELEESQFELRRAVEIQRENGASWADVGELLGISKQAAQQRFGKTA